jgi:hypothetical protein
MIIFAGRNSQSPICLGVVGMSYVVSICRMGLVQTVDDAELYVVLLRHWCECIFINVIL